MNFYFAGPYSDRLHIGGLARQFERTTGNKVIGSWLDGEDSSEPNMLRLYAAKDLNEVERCDALVIFLDNIGNSQGGMFVEMGAALMLGKEVYTVGRPNHNIFSRLADREFTNEESFFKADWKDSVY